MIAQRQSRAKHGQRTILRRCGASRRPRVGRWHKFEITTKTNPKKFWKNMKILHFDELILTSASLERLSAEEYSVLVALAAVADEVQVFLNLLAQAETDIPSDERIKHAFRVQFFILFRTTVSKSYEVLKLIDASNAMLRKSSSLQVDVFSRHSDKRRALKKSRFFQLTKKVRNTASNHFDVVQLSNQLATLSERGPIEAYLNKSRANTVYAFGDSLLQFAALNAVSADGESPMYVYQSLGSQLIKLDPQAHRGQFDHCQKVA